MKQLCVCPLASGSMQWRILDVLKSTIHIEHHQKGAEPHCAETSKLHMHPLRALTSSMHSQASRRRRLLQSNSVLVDVEMDGQSNANTSFIAADLQNVVVTGALAVCWAC